MPFNRSYSIKSEPPYAAHMLRRDLSGMRFVTAMAILALGTVWTAFAASADKIDLANGDSIEVEVIEETDEMLIVEHPQLGRMEIQKSQLKQPEPDAPGLFGTAILRGWNRRITAGLSGAQGNSEDFNVNAGITIRNETDTYRGLFNSAWFWSSGDGDRSTNNVFALYQHDFLFAESPLYIFLNTRYAYDEFQLWKHRVTGSGGLGYQIIKNDAIQLRGELGTGFNWSSYPFDFLNPFPPDVDTQNWKGEVVVGLVFGWNVVDGQKFVVDLTYLPDIQAWSEFRILADAAYEIALSERFDLSLKIGLNNEYDTEARPERNNLKYYGNLVYEF